jgi:hypothetical protein
MLRENRALLATVLLLAAILAPGRGRAQGYPVIDAQAIAKAVENVNAVAEQVRALNEMLVQVQSMVATVGKEGVPTLAFQAVLSQSGISRFGPPVRDLIQSVDATWTNAQALGDSGRSLGKSFRQLLDDADKAKGQTSSSPKPDFSSLAKTQAWVRKELTVSPEASLTAIDLTRKARSMLAGEAAADGYAMALAARQQMGTTGDRARTLADQVGGARDMRSDLQANTAVMLAMHDELSQVQALLAAVLEVESAGRLAELDPAASHADAPAPDHP